PHACASAGLSVLTGSDAKPTHITTTRNAASVGSLRSSARLSRRLAPAWRRWPRGWTSSRPTTKTTYESELSANAHGTPSVATITAAVVGPITRARLNVSELSATAWGTSSSSTSCVISAACAGAANAAVTPAQSENAITVHSSTAPANASVASSADSDAATHW